MAPRPNPHRVPTIKVKNLEIQGYMGDWSSDRKEYLLRIAADLVRETAVAFRGGGGAREIADYARNLLAFTVLKRGWFDGLIHSHLQDRAVVYGAFRATTLRDVAWPEHLHEYLDNDLGQVPRTLLRHDDLPRRQLVLPKGSPTGWSILRRDSERIAQMFERYARKLPARDPMTRFRDAFGDDPAQRNARVALLFDFHRALDLSLLEVSQVSGIVTTQDVTQTLQKVAREYFTTGRIKMNGYAQLLGLPRLGHALVLLDNGAAPSKYNKPAQFRRLLFQTRAEHNADVLSEVGSS